MNIFYVRTRTQNHTCDTNDSPTKNKQLTCHFDWLIPLGSHPGAGHGNAGGGPS